MKCIDRLRRSRPSLRHILVAVLLFHALPARAAVLADFNGDGVLDRAVLQRTTRTRIILKISGARPQVLRLADPLLSFAAVDIDRDGDLDLGTLSQWRGVAVWLNQGNGRFVRLPARSAPTGPRFSRAAQASAEDDGNGAPEGQGNDWSPSGIDQSSAGPLPQASTFLLSFSPTHRQIRHADSDVSRAPPAFTLTLS
jgi:hypothetical protein